MPYRTLGRIHALLARSRAPTAASARLRSQRGQGTVEYVGLILLLAGLLTGVVMAARSMDDGGGLAQDIADKLKRTIAGIGERER